MILKTLSGHLNHRLTVIRRFLPALAFFCGFTWDSVTMGRVVSFYDLLLLTTYYFGAGLILILLVREIKPQWENWFIFLIQFFFGGLFSALVVFYFKSSGSFYTFLVVIGLVVLLVTNEFLAEKYRSRTLNWTMLTACGTMYLNFLIPHMAHSIKPVWFYLSCIVSLIIVIAIHGFAGAKQRESMMADIKKAHYRKDILQLTPAVCVVLVLVLLYQLRLIPPVPLVLKESYICRSVKNNAGVYQCETEKQSLWSVLGLGDHSVYYQKGDKIYNLVAVFAPTMVKVDLEQRWWFHDKNQGWLPRGVIPLSMVGGRKTGWRTYSYIQKVARTGHWKVETALKDGAVLSVEYFKASGQIELPVEISTINVY